MCGSWVLELDISELSISAQVSEGFFPRGYFDDSVSKPCPRLLLKSFGVLNLFLAEASWME